MPDTSLQMPQEPEQYLPCADPTPVRSSPFDIYGEQFLTDFDIYCKNERRAKWVELVDRAMVKIAWEQKRNYYRSCLEREEHYKVKNSWPKRLPHPVYNREVRDVILAHEPPRKPHKAASIFLAWSRFANRMAGLSMRRHHRYLGNQIQREHR